jgi:molecular chaperone GrpE
MTEENNTTPDPNAAPNTETPEAAAAEETPAENATDAVFTEPAEDLKSLVAERDESKEKWLRAEAEMENVRRRARTEIDELRKYQALPVLRDVLAPIDNLRLALTAAETTGNVEELVKGIQMVLNQFDSVFSSHHAKVIESEGIQFDPNLHEALQQVPSADHEPMTVLQEFQRGYKMHDRVIRPSKVVVSSAPPESAPAAEPAATADSAEPSGDSGVESGTQSEEGTQS